MENMNNKVKLKYWNSVGNQKSINFIGNTFPSVYFSQLYTLTWTNNENTLLILVIVNCNMNYNNAQLYFY